MNASDLPAGSSNEPPDPWQQLSARATAVAKAIEEKVRKANTVPADTTALASNDSTDEMPPVAGDAKPSA